MLLLTLILIAPAAAGLDLLLAPRRVMALLNVLAFGATLGFGIALLRQVLARGVVTEWDEFLYADALSAWMVLLISVVSLGSSLYAGRYFERDLAAGVVTPGRVHEFFVLTPLFSTGMFLVVLANNLGVMWVAVEATALSSVLLVALYNRRTSLEAAWKYIMLGSLGLALALLGTVFVYAAACKNNSQPLPSFNWSHLMTVAGQFDPRMIKLAFLLVLIGYGTKAGLAPMHTWLPDAHSEAPSPTSAMLSGVSLKVAIYALLRFHILTSACLGSGFSRHLLLGFGLGSMFLAAPFILVQSNLKRMLAYSSLEHVGLICAGIALNTPVTIFGALLHMGYHALTKPVLFFAAGNIHQTFHSLQLSRHRSRRGEGAAGDGAVDGIGRRGRDGPAAVWLVFQRTDRHQRRICRGQVIGERPDSAGAHRGVLRHASATDAHSAGRAETGICKSNERRAVGRRAGDGIDARRTAGLQRVAARAAVAGIHQAAGIIGGKP